MEEHETGKILIVDDQSAIRYALTRFLGAEGFRVDTTEGGQEALGILSSESFDVVVMDVSMPGMDGLETLGHVKALHPKVQVILMTAFSSTERAIEAMKQGAFDFLLKPFENIHLLKVVNAAMESSRMLTDVVFIGRESTKRTDDRIVGNSTKMIEVFKQIGKVAPTEAPVLIVGETGTGKELVARAIYQHSLRSRKPFLAINCAAIPENLLESELFGHEKGAFTGAAYRHPGKFEQCHGGTLFLDEIGDLPATLQGKLLRILQDGSFQRVGGTETLHADVRLITATHRNLSEMAHQKTFREDLFYRINVVSIPLPPLRDRSEDLDDLVTYFIQKYNRVFGKSICSVASDTLDRLKQHSWPGNVRELENIIQKTMVMSSGDCLKIQTSMPIDAGCSNQSLFSCRQVVQSFVDQIFACNISCDLQEIIHQVEFQMISRALELTDQNQVQAARLLGIARNTLRKKL